MFLEWRENLFQSAEDLTKRKNLPVGELKKKKVAAMKTSERLNLFEMILFVTGNYLSSRDSE